VFTLLNSDENVIREDLLIRATIIEPAGLRASKDYKPTQWIYSQPGATGLCPANRASRALCGRVGACPRKRRN
jgi:hypothetical protein